MGLTVALTGFKVDLETLGECAYYNGVNALIKLAKASRAFQDDAREVIVGDTVFANPTWITLGTDLAAIKERASRYRSRKNQAIIANGGSLEPAMAIYTALLEKGQATVWNVDSPNPDDPAIAAMIHPTNEFSRKNSYLYAVSKSGETLNVILQALKFMASGFDVVPITDDKQSTLRTVIDRAGLDFIAHTDVGGRFTSNQPNSLIPLYAAAFYSDAADPSAAYAEHLDDFVAGLNSAAQRFAPAIPAEDNLAKKLALALYRAELAGYCEIYMPTYSKRLMGSAGITTQLFHETFGKGGKGQTLLAMEGPECQHHTNQRFFGGYPNMMGLLVGVRNYAEPGEGLCADVSGYEDLKVKGIGSLGSMHGMSFADLMQFERLGVYDAAKEKGIPVIDITLDRVDGDSLGKYMALMQAVAMYSAFLRGARWEDQPAVEDSKVRTVQMARHHKLQETYMVGDGL